MRSRSLLIFLILFAGGGVFLQGQQGSRPTPHFYNVDTEQQVEGVIREILFEPRYEDRASFLILILEEKKSRDIFRAEISPAWFFDHDLHAGENVKIIGSVYANQDGVRFVIARELQSAGETFLLRDNRGFPTWRGGKMKRAGPRKGRGF
ncbi:MAG: hypothetical protein JXE07_02465 [Candidatus Aminicenantes bacterium]|nr:hypothetical protein [Candidatus Aminicenantes bacterium]